MSTISKDTIYQEALERAITILTKKYPQRTERIQNTLSFITQDIVNHPDPVKAWSYSQLNNDGAPVEFTFSSLDDEVRYTVEVAGPDVQSKDRLTYVARLLSSLIPEASFEEIVTTFKRVQSERALRWGAWLGIRHQRDGEQYKVYAEVPQEDSSQANELIAQYLGSMPTLPNSRKTQLVALGQTLGSTRREFYLVLSDLGLQEAEIAHLLCPFGLENGEAKLLELMRDVRKVIFDSDMRSPLPEIEYAFSYSLLPGGKQPVFSIFTMAADYIGSDALTRYSLMVTAHRRGWPWESYAMLTEPIARQINRCAYHNVLAFILLPNEQCGMHISLSPPFPKG